MRTTLKRGIGRGAGLNEENGHAVFPPSVVSPVVRYRQPPVERSGLRLLTRMLVGTLLTLVAIALGIGGGALLWFHQSLSDVRAHSQDVISAQAQLDNVTLPDHATIALVIGYDQRAGVDYSTVSRSDTVMLIRADPVTKTISLLSFPRDLGVPIYCPSSGESSLGTQKINQAYAICGSKGTVDTIKHLTNLPINYLITINFHGFKEIVDKLGGIWMDVDRRYHHTNTGGDQNYASINVRPGYQRLTGQQALDFVRYRHTDDDYHRIARQQQFVRALKQQFAKNFSFPEVPSIVKTITDNVEVGGNPADSTILKYMYLGLTLPGGHFFQDKITGVTGDSTTYTAPANIEAAVNEFTHPDVSVSKAANAAALGKKAKPKKDAAPPPDKTTVLVLNGNGVEGAAADGSYLLRQRGYVTVLPPGQAPPNAPAQAFHSLIYYGSGAGAQAAAVALSKLIVPSEVSALPKDPKLRALDPGAMVTVVLGETFHNQLVTAPAAPEAPKHVPATVTYDPSVATALLQPYVHRVPFPLMVPTILDAYSRPDTTYGDQVSRLYWIDEKHKKKAVRLVFRTGGNEYWGIQETDMPDPPILDDRSFHRSIKGRVFSLYYTGSHLHMVVLRDHDRSYWVVNTLLDSLSNETMLAIAKGFKPLAAAK